MRRKVKNFVWLKKNRNYHVCRCSMVWFQVGFGCTVGPLQNSQDACLKMSSKKEIWLYGIMGRSLVGLGAFEYSMPYLVWFKLGMPNIIVQCSIWNLTCNKWVPKKNWHFSQCTYCTPYTIWPKQLLWHAIYLLISHFELSLPNVPM